MKTRPEPPHVLAIDIGTSAVKAGIFDRSARAVGESVVTVPHQQRLGADGTSEEPAEAILLATEQAVDGVLAAAGSLGLEVAAVAADSMAGTMLGIDDAGLPVTPVYTYADTRSASDVQRLLSDLDVPAVYQRTGCPQHTAYGPARVLWLRPYRPDQGLSSQMLVRRFDLDLLKMVRQTRCPGQLLGFILERDAKQA